MKYTMSILQIPFNKIIEGSKKIEMRLYDEKRQKVRLNDIIEFVNAANGESVKCLVRGILVFESFNMIIDLLPLSLFGYENKDEVKLRIGRLFSEAEQDECGVVGYIIDPINLQ